MAAGMTTAPLQNAGVKFPPPFLFVIAFLAGVAIDRWIAPLSLAGARSRPLIAAGWLMLLAGLAVTLWGLATFRMARTAIIPNRPARTIVASGPYRFSRNPMYVGVTALYVGLALLVNDAWPLLLLPLVLAALYTFVIRREERYLSSAFGTEYQEYCRRVRRWL
jgi:protein-S-isoprenylcysteine O-methyltransferase Ste14